MTIVVLSTVGLPSKLVLKVSLRYPYGYLSHLTDMLTKADKINCTGKLLPHSQYDGKFKIYIYE